MFLKIKVKIVFHCNCFISDVLLSSLFIIPRQLSSSEIGEISSTCTLAVEDAIFDIDDLLLNETTSFIVPSKCSSKL